jgi:hypothetical protein
VKKIVLNISDLNFEKFRYESIEQKKSINEILIERIFHKPFSENVENALEKFLESEIEQLLKD